MALPKKKREQIGRSVGTLLKLVAVNNPPVPVERIARIRGAQIRYVPFGGEMSGMIAKEEGNIIIGVNALHSKARQRFTIAHELGHLELGHLDQYSDDDLHVDRDFRILRRDEVSSQATDIIEIEANAFAAELLMPTSMIQHDLLAHGIDPEDDERIRSLATQYHVSVQAMTFRVARLSEELLLKRNRTRRAA